MELLKHHRIQGIQLTPRRIHGHKLIESSNQIESTEHNKSTKPYWIHQTLLNPPKADKIHQAPPVGSWPPRVLFPWHRPAGARPRWGKVWPPHSPSNRVKQGLDSACAEVRQRMRSPLPSGYTAYSMCTQCTGVRPHMCRTETVVDCAIAVYLHRGKTAHVQNLNMS